MTKKIVWTNGCFDVIHRGHIEMLEFAKSQGDMLIVGLDTDERVRSRKGHGRPVNSLADRMRVMKALRFVDQVVSFNSDIELIDSIKNSGASVIVVGSDYKKSEVIGREQVEEVLIYAKIRGYSTTRIISSSSNR